VSSGNIIRTILADCTEPQREAITATEGPLLVLAGPGSGKTRVITRRVAYLAATGVPAEKILAITFTNKAAGEMRDRIRALGLAHGAWISTFHSFCARVLRRYAADVGLSPQFTIYDAADSVATVRHAMSSLGVDPSVHRPGQVLRAISTAKNSLEGPDRLVRSGCPDAELVAAVYERYQAALAQSNAVDFDDLLLLVARLLEQGGRPADELRERFHYVLIDEYQDTNRAQYLIARRLVEGRRNICATGDPDQAIYGWRGADLRNILDFERDYPDARVVRLEQNYRSTRHILAAADALISNNRARKPKSLWTQNPQGQPVEIIRAEDESAEARLVAADIARLIRRERRSPRDIAVFYRINAQSRQIEAALRSEGIPYTVVAGTEFYERAEVKHLLAYLRLAVNPDDSVSAERVVNVPPRKFGATSLKRLRQWAQQKGISLFAALRRAGEAGFSGQALAAATSFCEVVTALSSLRDGPAAVALENLIRLTAFEDFLRGLDNADERLANVRELVNAASDYDREEPEGGVAGFLERVALVSDVDRWDPAAGAVALMTLHAAKGLEFPVAYIMGLEEGLLPLRGDEAPHELEEERRLLFVGITRAKERVTLSFAETRLWYGRTVHTQPSRFLEELPPGAATPVPGRAARLRPRAIFNAWRPNARHGPGLRRVRRGESEEIVYDGDRPAEECPFRPGDTVRHETYGRGTVLEVAGYGEQMRAVVRFDGVGVKRLMLAYARLRKL